MVELSQKIINILSSSRWFHATTMEDYESIRKNGIIVDYNRGNELDFGYGFYLSPKIDMSENYLRRLYKNITGENNKDYIILEYNFQPINWFTNPNYKSVVFEKFDDDFAEFVFNNRLNCNSIKQHDYDVVYGVMSDSVPTQLILNYKADEISREDVISGLKKSNSAKQISIHNQELCDNISLANVYTFNPFTNERKEIEVK